MGAAENGESMSALVGVIQRGRATRIVGSAGLVAWPASVANLPRSGLCEVKAGRCCDGLSRGWPEHAQSVQTKALPEVNLKHFLRFASQ